MRWRTSKTARHRRMSGRVAGSGAGVATLARSRGDDAGGKGDAAPALPLELAAALRLPVKETLVNVTLFAKDSHEICVNSRSTSFREHPLLIPSSSVPDWPSPLDTARGCACPGRRRGQTLPSRGAALGGRRRRE